MTVNMTVVAPLPSAALNATAAKPAAVGAYEAHSEVLKQSSTSVCHGIAALLFDLL